MHVGRSDNRSVFIACATPAAIALASADRGDGSQARSPESTVYMGVERRAGHGEGNALSKSINRDCDTLAFLCDKLGGPMQDLPKISRV